jgi:hypothetical protein
VAVLIVVVPQTSRLFAVTTIDTIGDGRDQHGMVPRLVETAQAPLDHRQMPIRRGQADDW